jgi:hypothetical protein
MLTAYVVVTIIVFVIAALCLVGSSIDLDKHNRLNCVTESDKNWFRWSLVGVVLAPIWPVGVLVLILWGIRTLFRLAKVAWA